MMEYHSTSTNNSHPYSSCCGYCNHDEYTFGEDSIMSYSPPIFDNIAKQQEEPYKYNYLLNLMTAPDLNAFLSVASFTDDIYALPIHLQRLISEAREEILLSATNKNYKEKSAQLRLERVRNVIWLRSYGDFSILMNALVELVSDEDELEDLLRI